MKAYKRVKNQNILLQMGAFSVFFLSSSMYIPFSFGVSLHASRDIYSYVAKIFFTHSLFPEFLNIKLICSCFPLIDMTHHGLIVLIHSER